MSILKHDLQLDGYPQGFTDSVINRMGSIRPNVEESLWILHISHM
jgi:hypothetical protein